jgi:hypothetical protein
MLGTEVAGTKMEFEILNKNLKNIFHLDPKVAIASKIALTSKT